MCSAIILKITGLEPVTFLSTQTYTHVVFLYFLDISRYIFY